MRRMMDSLHLSVGEDGRYGSSNDDEDWVSSGDDEGDGWGDGDIDGYGDGMGGFVNGNGFVTTSENKIISIFRTGNW